MVIGWKLVTSVKSLSLLPQEGGAVHSPGCWLMPNNHQQVEYEPENILRGRMRDCPVREPIRASSGRPLHPGDPSAHVLCRNNGEDVGQGQRQIGISHVGQLYGWCPTP